MRLNEHGKSTFRLRLPRDAKPSMEALVPAFAALHPLGLRLALQLFADGSGAELRYRVTGPGAAGVFARQLGAAYPGARIDEVEAPTPARCTLRATFAFRQPAAIPLPSPGGPPKLRGLASPDAILGILAALDDVQPGELACLEVVLGQAHAPNTDPWAPQFLRSVEAHRQAPRNDGSLLGLFRKPPNPLLIDSEQRLADAVRLKAQLPQFDTSIRLQVSTGSRERTVDLVRNLVAPVAALAEAGLNELVPVLEGSTRDEGKKPASSLHPVRLSALELVGLWRPPESAAAPGRGCFLKTTDLDLPRLPGHGVQLGWTAPGADATPLVLPFDDLRRHALFLGASGGGKSTSLLTLMLSLIEQGHGCGLVDVKGDLADDLLGRIPAHRRSDVHVIDPTDEDSGAGIDLFGVARRLDLDLSADFVVSAFQAQFSESWGVSFPRPMKAAVRALLEVPGTSLLDLPRMLRDPDFREAVLAQVSDESVRDYFRLEFEGQSRSRQAQSIGPALTRIGSALDSGFGRRLFGPNTGPDLRKVMDNKSILVCRYHGGYLGKGNASLFAGLTAAACQLAAMTRVDLPERERVSWTLVCDEAHEYANASFAEALSLGRGYGYSLALATQFLNQVPAQVRSSVLANISTLVCFRLGEEDVSLVGRRFEPQVSRHELTDLSNFVGLVRASFAGKRQPPFALHVRPPAVAWDAAVAAEVRTRSRQSTPVVSPTAPPVPSRPKLTVVPFSQVRWDDIEESEG